MKDKPKLDDADNKPNATVILVNAGFTLGRMISAYKDAPKGHFAVFNANIVTAKDGKVWYGDLDLTLDAAKLRATSVVVGGTLYVLREMDARFDTESEKPGKLAGNAVWDTTKGTPRYGKAFKVELDGV